VIRIAIFDPFSGIAGDMCLGALLDAGLEESFIAELPKTLGIEGVTVRIAKVKRGRGTTRQRGEGARRKRPRRGGVAV
jgi:uncharacterized protein (DUF111 family)